MFLTLLILLVLTANGVPLEGSIIHNEDDIAKTPLIDNLKAPLFAEINMSSVDQKLRQFVMDAVKKTVKGDVEKVEQKINVTITDHIRRLEEKINDINANKIGNRTEQVVVNEPHECEDIPSAGNGTYNIFPKGANHPIGAYCIVDSAGTWTVIQRRFNRKNDAFFRTWNEYKNGFGDVAGDHWLGDSMDEISSTGHKVNGHKFSTKDQDNDLLSSSPDCATYYKSGWWYNRCYGWKLNMDDARWLYNFGNVDKSVMMIKRR